MRESRVKDEITIRRSEAAAIIEGIRVLLAQGTPPKRIEAWLAHELHGLHAGVAHAGPPLPPLKPCPGGAHSNPYIDNCSTCAPRWGLVGPTVRVK